MKKHTQWAVLVVVVGQNKRRETQIGKDTRRSKRKEKWTRGEKMTRGIGQAQDRQSSQRMSDSFTNDLWMIYQWACLCLSEHQRPFKSGSAVSGHRVELWLLTHHLQVDPQDGNLRRLPESPPPTHVPTSVCRHSPEVPLFKVKGLPRFSYLFTQKIKPRSVQLKSVVI